VIYEDFVDSLGNTALGLSIILLFIATAVIMLYRICYKRIPSRHAVAPVRAPVAHQTETHPSVSMRTRLVPFRHPDEDTKPSSAPPALPANSTTQPKNHPNTGMATEKPKKNYKVVNPGAQSVSKQQNSEKSKRMNPQGSKTNKPSNRNNKTSNRNK